MKRKTDSLERYLRRPTRQRLARVVKDYYKFVWEIGFRVTGNEDDAADVAQDVFLTLLLEPPRRERVSSSAGFLAWSVVRRASRFKRAAQRRAQREERRGDAPR